MLDCPDPGVTVAVSAVVVDCGAYGVAYEVRPTEDAVGMGVVGMPLAVATSRTRTCTRTTRVRTSRRVDTADRMRGGTLEVSVVVMARGLTSQSPVNRSWFATWVKFCRSRLRSARLTYRQLPWSTANEDLVELFETTGQVELAEILFDGTRSKGAGVVQFAQVAEAETAIGAFPSPCFFFVSETAGGCSQVPAVYVWWTTSRCTLQ
jgi:hypothetical protein